MIVVTLSECPSALRGDLSKWLQEISVGVYVGNVNPRVRLEIWKRICSNIKSGRATMAFSSNNEQHMDFFVHNTGWDPVDFDGLKLIMRPSATRLQSEEKLLSGFSNIAKIRKGRQSSRISSKKNSILEEYVVIDIETTGLSLVENEIIEIAAILVCNKEIECKFQSLVKCESKISSSIQELTGITNELLNEDGRELASVLVEFLKFVDNYTVVSHNAEFDYSFIRRACNQFNLPVFSNKCIDTLSLSRRRIEDVRNYKLKTLIEYFGIETNTAHRSLADCLATHQLYEKLNEIE